MERKKTNKRRWLVHGDAANGIVWIGWGWTARFGIIDGAIRGGDMEFVGTGMTWVGQFLWGWGITEGVFWAH